MKYNLAFIAIFYFSHCLIAQDSSARKLSFNLPVGIYYTSKSFIAKKPDLKKPFRVVVNYSKQFVADSIIYGNTFEMIDSTNIEGYVFGFYDGEDMYINIDQEIHGGFFHKNRGGFFKVEKLGRHSYILTERGLQIPFVIFMPLTAAAAITTVSVNALMAAKASSNINKMDIYYFNRKRKLIKATPTGIGFLLKDEKDLFEAYENESKITNEIMLKYLKKINDRYPDWQP
jgi:hypothetical protein